jgi:hypothetical protein
MNHLSSIIKDKDFINIDIVKPGYHWSYGKNPAILYLNIEPYNRTITPKYEDKLIDKIINKKAQIFNAFPDTRLIVIDDIFTIKK